jgi:hypothetical protein
MAADTTWENAVSHARGEPDGAEKSFHKKKSKVSVKVYNVFLLFVKCVILLFLTSLFVHEFLGGFKADIM